MNFSYAMTKSTELSPNVSVVTVDITASERINGFSSATLTFEVPTKTLKGDVAERVKWKIKQETGLDSDKYTLTHVEPSLPEAR